MRIINSRQRGVKRDASGSSPIAMVNLEPLLEQTQKAWQKHLGEMRASMRFINAGQVKQFESAFAGYLRAKACIGCGSGTSAIELALRAAKITRADQKVLVPAFTSPFTAQAILAAGARPMFADVDGDTLLLDPLLAAENSNGAAAILPVHLYGSSCDLPALRKTANRNGCVLIQDACQAHGATCDDRPFTDFSPFVAYSFYPTKNLGCLGDGGAVVTSSDRIADRLRLLRDGGRRDDQLSRIVAVNSRLDEMQACFLRAFLPRLDNWNATRARLAQLYDSALAGCPDVKPVKRDRYSSNHLYVIKAPRREKLRAALEAQGIQTAVHYPVPLHMHPAFKPWGTKRGSLPNAERAGREVLSLPLHPSLREDEVLRVATAISCFYRT